MPDSNLKLLYLQREKKKGEKKGRNKKQKSSPSESGRKNLKDNSNHASKMTHIPTVAPLIYNTIDFPRL